MNATFMAYITCLFYMYITLGYLMIDLMIRSLHKQLIIVHHNNAVSVTLTSQIGLRFRIIYVCFIVILSTRIW